jgi:hypothetical protein
LKFDFPALGITPNEEARFREAENIRNRSIQGAIREAEQKEQLAIAERNRTHGWANIRRKDAALKLRDRDNRQPEETLAAAVMRVPSPDLDNPEDPRNRVLFITNIPTEVDNDEVMTFLQEYRPESIDRNQIGGNWMYVFLYEL